MSLDDLSTRDGDFDPATAEMLALDALLDSALADSFPASDPPALCSPQGYRAKGRVSATLTIAQEQA